MNKTVSTHSKLDPNTTFPASVLSVSRDEFGYPEDNPDAQYPPLTLQEKEGKPLTAENDYCRLVTSPRKKPKKFSVNILDGLKITGKFFLQFLRALVRIFTDNFIYLVLWDSSGGLQSWQVLHPGFLLKIK